jgi:hypothetical protein
VANIYLGVPQNSSNLITIARYSGKDGNIEMYIATSIKHILLYHNPHEEMIKHKTIQR